MEGAVRYHIEIRAIVKRTKKVGHDWTIVGQKMEGDKPFPLYGYTPVIEKEVEEEIVLFEQRMTDIDMREVVAVINAIPIDRTKSRP